MGNVPNAERLHGRTGRIWRAYVDGHSEQAIAGMLGIGQGVVSRSLIKTRATIPDTSIQDMKQRELEFIDSLRRRALEIAAIKAPPVTAGKDGNVVYDPSTGEIVRDYSGQLAAIKTAAAMSERIAKTLGLDAAQKIEVSTEADARAKQIAEQARARVMAQPPLAIEGTITTQKHTDPGQPSQNVGKSRRSEFVQISEPVEDR